MNLDVSERKIWRIDENSEARCGWTFWTDGYKLFSELQVTSRAEQYEFTMRREPFEYKIRLTDELKGDRVKTVIRLVELNGKFIADLEYMY